MKVSISTYWKCQLIGWGAWSLFDYFIVRFPFITSLMASVFGLAFTHFLRYLIKQFKILNKTIVTQIVYLLLLNSILAFFGTCLFVWVLDVTKNLASNPLRLSFWGIVFWGYHQTLSAGTAWAAIYFAVHYIRDLKKTEQEKNALRISLAESETMALRAQMNPRFILKGMNSIKSFVIENENEKAANYLTTFSKLIRSLFQNSDKRQISLHDEIETCKLYLQLEPMRLNGKLTYNINIDPNLDLKSVMVPALIVQPFIENAIWHGLVPKNGGTINISVTGNDDKILCEVDDDGIGRERSKLNKPITPFIHEPKGVHLSNQRLNLEKVLNGTNASIQTIDKAENNIATGTKVVLTFDLH